MAGPRLINDQVRAETRRLLGEIQDGSFAKRWIEEGQRGAPEFRRLRAQNAHAPIEEVGAELRSHMAFINPMSAPEGWVDGGGVDAARSPAESTA